MQLGYTLQRFIDMAEFYANFTPELSSGRRFHGDAIATHWLDLPVAV